MKLRGFRVEREPYILKRSASAKTILHVGCACSPYTQYAWEQGLLMHKPICEQARRLGQKVVGIDIDRGAVEWLSERMPGERIIYGDAQELGEFLPGEKFDLVIAGDVIEHLPDPGRFLRRSREALAVDGVLLVTTANAFGVARFVKTLVDHEAVHPEHTAYYSMGTMKRLAEMSGFRMEKSGYYACEPYLTKNGVNGFVSTMIERTVCLGWPQLAEGLVAELTAEH